MEQSKKNNLLSYLLIAVLVIAVIALSGTVVKNISKGQTPETQDTLPPSTSAATTLMTTATQPTLPPTSTTAQTQDVSGTTVVSATTAAQVTSKDEVCTAYNSALNALKDYKGSVTVHKDEKIDMTITEFSLPAPMEQVNSVMRSIVPDTLEDYSFENGVRSDDKDVTLTGTIPPFNKTACVGAGNVSVAEIKDTSGGKEITLKLIPENSSYDGTATTPTPNMSSLLDPLDFATSNMGPIGIQKAQISYPEATITALTDSAGRMTKLTIQLPVVVSCTGGMSVFTADVGLDMKVTTVYEITYK